MLLFFLLVTVGFFLSHSESFTAVPSVAPSTWTVARASSSSSTSRSRHCRPHSRLGVRNIDLCEAVIFYGRDSLFEPDDSTTTLLPGVETLVIDCQRDGTVVLAIVESQDESIIAALPKTMIHIHLQTQSPPNPRDVWEAIHNRSIHPKGFGGSSGFGTKAADPERSPLPQHTVVLCDTADKCRAARYAGMRVVCLHDNDIADAVVDAWDDITVDDIATPGSFWLNPPYAKDDEGNGVDPFAMMLDYEKGQQQQQQQQQDNDSSSSSPSGTDDDDNDDDDDLIMNDDQLAAILADMDPL